MKWKILDITEPKDYDELTKAEINKEIYYNILSLLVSTKVGMVGFGMYASFFMQDKNTALVTAILGKTMQVLTHFLANPKLVKNLMVLHEKKQDKEDEEFIDEVHYGRKK